MYLTDISLDAASSSPFSYYHHVVIDSIYIPDNI